MHTLALARAKRGRVLSVCRGQQTTNQHIDSAKGGTADLCTRQGDAIGRDLAARVGDGGAGKGNWDTPSFAGGRCSVRRVVTRYRTLSS